MSPLTKPRNPVFCALDTADAAQAKAWANSLAGAVGGIKLGLEFFGAHGLSGVMDVVRGCGLPLFLDLKFHDIPNTVAGAMRYVMSAQPFMTTVHAAGGRAMMKAAIDAAGDSSAKISAPRPKVLGITILTSLDDGDLESVGMRGSTGDQVRRLAGLARDSGLDGVVCSPHEAGMLRRELGSGFLLVTPGVRPTWAGAQDQKRVMTPAEVMATGADYVVVGRPITGASDQAAAAARIVTELAA